MPYSEVMLPSSPRLRMMSRLTATGSPMKRLGAVEARYSSFPLGILRTCYGLLRATRLRRCRDILECRKPSRVTCGVTVKGFISFAAQEV